MDASDESYVNRPRRLTFTIENFDDYLVALMAKLRINPIADRILSGELLHPLISFQINNQASLAALQVPFFAPAQLLTNPALSYVQFLRFLTNTLLRASPPVPAVDDLNEL